MMCRFRFLFAVAALEALSGCHPKAPQGQVDDSNPHWVLQQTPPAKVALVFVHGVTGDMIGTWTAANGKKFWELVDENDQLKAKTDAFAYGFPSYTFKSGSFDIQEAANRLHDRLEYHQVLNYPAIVFVAHSMGGLVVMRELLTHHEILSKVPVVMFYATPMEGSLVAEIFKRFSPNSALSEMTPANGNALLQTLDSEWKSLSAKERPHVKCAYENEPIGPSRVVPWTSATRFCEGATPAIAATHITIVKPERPGDDAIVELANALNEFVLGRQIEAKLETPDFIREGSENVFILRDSYGRQPARLLNEGGSSLRFTFTEIDDSSLWLTPDDTPRDIAGHSRMDMHIGLGRGATRSEYHFILRTTVQPDMRITVRVPDLGAITAQQEDVARKVAQEINQTLTNPYQLVRFRHAATDDKEVPEEIVQVAHNAVAQVTPELPASTQWVLTADLLNSLNWPSLAGSALKSAEKVSPAAVQAPYVQFLSALVAKRSGERHIFLNARTPVANPDALNEWSAEQPFTRPAVAGLGYEVAEKMQQVPPLKAYGFSLTGDLELAKGNTKAAHAAYLKAAEIRPSPVISTHLNNPDQPQG